MARLACLVLLATSTLVQAQDPAPAQKPQRPQPDRWEEAIQTFERQNTESPPAPGGIVFIGSSSIRGWKLQDFFPELPVQNRGFGGSQLADAARYADRILRPLEPRLVILYEGDNDIVAGKSPQEIRDDFRQFVRNTRAAAPGARIIVLSIKPSPSRWRHWDRAQEANLLIARECAEDSGLTYVDVATPLLGPDGKPRPEFYVSDGVHLSQAGYQVWTDRVRPLLEAHGFTPERSRRERQTQATGPAPPAAPARPAPSSGAQPEP